MLVEKVSGNISDYSKNKEISEVFFEWFELEKKRIKKTAQDGTEIGIAVNCPLSEGDILFETEDKIYVVALKDCELIKINISSIEEMGRAAFELGNRHMSLKIGQDNIKTIFDQVTYDYLKKLGFSVERIREKFSQYIVCKGHDHSDNHMHNHKHLE